MKDLYREYLMGHTLGVKKHYFNWQSQKLDILYQYLHCNFNKKNGNYGEQISTLREDSKSKDEEIAKLRKQLEQQEKDLNYFKSEKFTNSLISKIAESKGTVFDIIDNKESKTVQVKIPIDSGKELKRLINEGYSIEASDSEFFYLSKEIDGG